MLRFNDQVKWVKIGCGCICLVQMFWDDCKCLLLVFKIFCKSLF